MATEQISALQKEMEQLVAQLNEASDAYYNGKSETMTDHEWDVMFDRLQQLENRTGVILPNSPTNNVSADNFQGKKEVHEYPALSLAKTKKTDELAKWAEMKPIWLSWKLDGLTLVATYDNGRLTKVVTRGDGHIGTNITHLATAVNGIPQTIDYNGHLVVRGEAVISYADFEQFNMESEETYANPRNLASGSLTLKDPDEVRNRKIRWIPFTLVHTDEDIPSWGERMQRLQQLGFHPVERQLIEQPTPHQLQMAIDQWTRRVTGEDKVNMNPYPVDGLVITYDDTLYAQSGNVTGHHATRAGYAFKWQDESVTTTLQYIEWSCAASTISPVAVFTPVQLEGTTVKRASLCNISECERLGIGGQGTKIEVIKANKIIPKVIGVTHTEGQLDIPHQCPVCQSPTIVTTSKIGGTRTLHCTNSECPAKQLKKFVRFVSKDGLDIDGISEQTIAKFINLGWLKEWSDFYRLHEHREEMSSLEGFGRKSVTNLLQSIENSRNVDANRLLYAMSIPLCGKDVCRKILTAHPLNDLVQIAGGTAADTNTPLPVSPVDVLAAVPGIGPEKSASMVKWFSNAHNRRQWETLITQLNIAQTDNQPAGNRCHNLTFVVTGDVHHFKNRNELKAYIESEGGKVTGSVSKSTNYLINNDLESNSSKNQKAKQLNIEIISEDTFIQRFMDNTQLS